MSIMYATSYDTGYYFYKIAGEEIGSLTGVFQQGNRENLIVFSDEYFEKAQKMWESRNIWTGESIEDEAGRIENVTIYQGATKLVLLNCNENNLDSILIEMEGFSKRHKDLERQVYINEYDTSVLYCYAKEDAVKKLNSERILRVTMNLFVIILFFVMRLVLILIKILSEKDENEKRLEFLTCMGMRQKNRIRLVRKELLRYYFIFPIGIAIGVAIIFTRAVFQARIYTAMDIIAYLKIMIPLWSAYFTILLIILYVMVSIYVYKMEKVNKNK